MFPFGNDQILLEVDMFRIKRSMFLFGCHKRGTISFPKLADTWVYGFNRCFSNPADVPTNPEGCHQRSYLWSLRFDNIRLRLNNAFASEAKISHGILDK